LINRDPRCIFVTDHPGEADVVVIWLGQQEIAAQVMNRNTMGGLEGLTPWVGVSARGIEVWVKDADDASRAGQLLAAHHALQAGKAPESTTPRGPVNVLCEECGASVAFPGADHGSVQDCPECGAFIDVLDGDEEWEEPADEGEEDEARE
jgi:hypothetical protein